MELALHTSTGLRCAPSSTQLGRCIGNPANTGATARTFMKSTQGTNSAEGDVPKCAVVSCYIKAWWERTALLCSMTGFLQAYLLGFG
jgi:hypothetical protein